MQTWCRGKKQFESEILCTDCHMFSWRSYSDPDFLVRVMNIRSHEDSILFRVHISSRLRHDRLVIHRSFSVASLVCARVHLTSSSRKNMTRCAGRRWSGTKRPERRSSATRKKCERLSTHVGRVRDSHTAQCETPVKRAGGRKCVELVHFTLLNGQDDNPSLRSSERVPAACSARFRRPSERVGTELHRKALHRSMSQWSNEAITR